MADETYDPARVEQLRAMLRALAQHIVGLDADHRLLDQPGSLLKLLGDVRAELFQYEVRVTYDSPETAEHRRIVGEAGSGWSPGKDAPDDEEDGWQPPDVR